MKPNHEKALIVAYYLSKFDKKAAENLGFKNRAEAFTVISRNLNMKRSTLRFMRDEFDVLHPHRKGWYQSPMPPSRVKVVESFQNLEELSLRSIVQDISDNCKLPDSDTLKEIIKNIELPDDKTPIKAFTGARGITGKNAEEIFIEFFDDNNFPLRGELKDVRETGCGYDFLLNDKKTEYYIEVKGLASESGGILMTDKEWATANAKGNNYYLVIISSIDIEPKITIIQNPKEKLTPKRNTYTSIQVNWQVDKNAISKLLKN